MVRQLLKHLRTLSLPSRFQIQIRAKGVWTDVRSVAVGRPFRVVERDTKFVLLVRRVVGSARRFVTWLLFRHRLWAAAVVRAVLAAAVVGAFWWCVSRFLSLRVRGQNLWRNAFSTRKPPANFYRPVVRVNPAGGVRSVVNLRHYHEGTFGAGRREWYRMSNRQRVRVLEAGYALDADLGTYWEPADDYEEAYQGGYGSD